jgi:hypothetical protein
VQEHHVHVGRVVQLAPAQLAHPDHRELGAADASTARSRQTSAIAVSSVITSSTAPPPRSRAATR